MVSLIAETGKYVCILLMMLYTYFMFAASLAKKKKRRQALTKSMNFCSYFIHLVCYLVLYVANSSLSGTSADDVDGNMTAYFYAALYAAEFIVLIVSQVIFDTIYKEKSGIVAANMRLFIVIGFIMVTRLDFDNGFRQFLFVACMLVVMLFVPYLIEKFKLWENLKYIYTFLGLFLLIAVLIFGKELYGAKNWIVIGGISIQPSELVKILFIFGMSALLYKYRSKKELVLITLAAMLFPGILVLEKDLGCAFILFITFVILVYASTGRFKYAGLLSAAGAAGAVLSYFAFSHVRVRVEAFLDPLGKIESSGYQVSQSLFAIGTGNWLGMGLTRGLPDSIPVADSDFIYSAVFEEFGGIFAILLILVFIDTFIMMVSISLKLFNPFYKLVSLGISFMFMTQVFLNIGGVTKFIPSTGITLPLISYGGSSIVASMLMFAIIEGMYVLHEKELVKVRQEVIEQHSLYNTDFIEGSKNDKKAEIINKQILKISFAMSFLLFLVIAYIIYFVVFKSESFINNSANARTELLEESVIRGEIVSADGKVLAETKENNDGSTQRVYNFGKVYAHTVGRVDESMTGVELSENFTLLTCGINIADRISLQLQGEKIPGNTVRLTIDSELQEAAYEALGNYRGAVVVIEPATGAILAMVSKPSYDPNTVEENWDTLISDENSSAPLLNRATQGLYAPGSTFKILTLLEYIHENPETYDKYTYTCKGDGRFDGVTIHCPLSEVHGKENLKESFANSCNTSFANIGCKLNLDSLNSLAESFLFNVTLPCDMLTGISNFSLTSESDKTTVAQSVIGLSSDTISPIHEAMIAAAIANGGVLMKPYIVDSILNANGRVLRKTLKDRYGSIMTADDADILTEYMEYVVEKGTAAKLNGLSVKVAGKTGTATYDTDENPHAWFMGFAPADDPKIAISVIVESSGAGSSYAVPIAKKLLKVYFERKE